MRYAVMKVLYPESIICLWSHQLQSLPAERLLIPYVGFQPDLDNSHFSNQLIIYYFNGRKGVLINLSGHRHVLDCVGNFVIHRFLVRYSVSGMEWMGCTPAFSIFPFLSMECVCVCVEVRWWEVTLAFLHTSLPGLIWKPFKTHENTMISCVTMISHVRGVKLDFIPVWWQARRAVYQTWSWFTKHHQAISLK